MSAWLFVPGDRPDRFAKAHAAGAETIVVDLEDAVAAERKPPAREAVRAALAGGLQACVRISAAASSDFALDLAALAERPPRSVMIAKTSAAADVAAVRSLLPDTPVIALIESLSGIAHLASIARARNVCGIAFGAYDLCAELGARPVADVLAPWRSRIVTAARVAGIRAIDTPYVLLGDTTGLSDDARHSVDFGFDAKLAIHPGQIAAIDAAFTPTALEVLRAQEMIEAGRAGGAVRSGDMMVDAPLLQGARRVIERAQRAAKSSSP
jgi:citrate lyase subunit beta/citryl-CoA lyase